MIHDLEDVKKMFKTADEIIQERPELLSMNVDEIFDELDDGTPEMIHNRWGVMTRVKITELTSFDNKSIIDFFVSIKEIQGLNAPCYILSFLGDTSTLRSVSICSSTVPVPKATQLRGSFAT